MLVLPLYDTHLQTSLMHTIVKEYLNFFKTWSNWKLGLEHFKNTIQNRGHRACFGKHG